MSALRDLLMDPCDCDDPEWCSNCEALRELEELEEKARKWDLTAKYYMLANIPEYLYNNVGKLIKGEKTQYEEL